ncbi:MAG: YDG domain-containing protein, partial [Spongiibacteraceae bacterium]
NANGQVYLINPNGVLFGQGAQVNVGALVASTLDLNDAALTGDKRSFSGNGAGSVINRGAINAIEGGYVALLGNQVGNEGVITAPSGAVALGAGSAATLTFSNNSLVGMQVDASVLNSQADNGGLIRADGGIVVMTAGAKDSLLASVVNNTGVIEARTVENRDGSIVLLGGMQAGTVNVAGTLDASAADGGNGGFIETSAAHVQVAGDAKITTAAAMGLAGTWLIDPVDFTIAASGGDITGAALSSNLGSGNVVIQSTTGSAGTLGDVNVNDAVTWSANKLTLNAQNNININANLNASSSASLALEYGQGAVAAGNTSSVVTHGASVNLPASTTNFTTRQGSNGVVKNYTVITSLGAAGSTTATDLQGMAGNLAANYALGSNIDAAATSSWNAGAGFTPIGTDPSRFAGVFDGLGHTVSGVYINRTGSNFTGLFGYTAAGSMVRNVGLVGGSVASDSWATGALVGSLAGMLKNSTAAVSVSGFQTAGGLVGVIDGGAIIDSHASGDVIGYGNGEAGGLVGLSWGPGGGTVNNSYATGNVSSPVGNVGGLMGINWGHITNSYATGTATGTDYIGGLVGNNSNGSVASSYATGAANGRDYVGGLVGNNSNSVSNSHATGAATGSNNVGGLAGNNNGNLSANYATGAVTGSNAVGGLIGTSTGTTSNSYATGAVNGDTRVGGLIGYAGDYGSVNNNHATGAVVGSGDYVGGLIGYSYGSTVSTSYATGAVIGRDFVGGLMGVNAAGSYGYGYGGAISDSYASGSVQARSYVGGLLGYNTSTATTTDSHALGSVTASRGDVGGLIGRNEGALSGVYATGAVQAEEHHIGGLVGYNSAPISNSYASGAVTGVGGASYVGGLVGRNYGSVSSSYATGDVQGFNYIGGLLGGNYGGVSTTYATGLVRSDNNAGGLIGSNYGSVTNSFWNTDTSEQASSHGGTGLTSNQMMQLASFSSWNVATPNTIAGTGGSGASWRIYEGHTAPLLTQFLTALTLTDATVVTYNGTAQNGMSVVPSGVLGATATNVGVYGFYSNQQGYDITGGTLTINKANLTLSTSNVSKTYDGTLVASGTATVVSGTLYTNASNGGLLDSLSGGLFEFLDANAGADNKTVTASGVTVSDGNSGGNYNVTYANNTTSTINKAHLTLSTNDVAKTYDGTLTAAGSALLTSGTLYNNVSNGNTLDSISGGIFSFLDANAGAGNKVVVTSGVSVNDGNNGGNYNVAYENNTASTISAANLIVSSSDVTKIYDGMLAAIGSATLTGGTLFGSDSLSGGSFAFADKNAGSGKTVTVTDVSVSDGNGGSNYSVTYTNNTTSTINAANLLLSTSNVTKIYDGGLAASGATTIAAGTLFGSDSLSGGSFAFTNKNVGAGNKTVTTTGVTVNDGNGGANYSVGYLDNTTSTITPARLAISGVTANDKVYDGTATTTLAGLAAVTPIGSDDVVVNGAGSGLFANADVGVGKTVTVSGFALSGSDAGNYAVVQPGGLTADIAEIVVVPDSTPIADTPSADMSIAELKSVTGQIQSSIFLPANVQSPPSLSPELVETQVTESDSSTSSAIQNIGMSDGRSKSLLQIVDGGMKLPGSSVEENDD